MINGKARHKIGEGFFCHPVSVCACSGSISLALFLLYPGKGMTQGQAHRTPSAAEPAALDSCFRRHDAGAEKLHVSDRLASSTGNGENVVDYVCIEERIARRGSTDRPICLFCVHCGGGIMHHNIYGEDDTPGMEHVRQVIGSACRTWTHPQAST